MIKVAFNARIGKDGAKFIETKKGGFISMDVAVETFVQGEKKPMWVRVKAFGEKLQKLLPYLTKGKAIEVAGEMGEPDAWNAQNGEAKARCVVYAKTINFMPGGKKKTENNDQTATADNTESQTKKEETPAQAPATTTPQEEQVPEMEMKERDDEDLPF